MIDLSRRDRAIDILRFAALIHMIFQHTVLALMQSSENTGITLFFYEIIPLCPALFLFVSGLSFTYSYKNRGSKNRWKKKLLYGLLLIIGGMVLFVVEHGFQLPDLFFASSIINTIGIFIISSSFIYRFINEQLRFAVLVIIFGIITLLFVYLISNSLVIFPLSTGYEPVLPTIIFGFAGLIFGELAYLSHNTRSKNSLLIIGIISFFILVLLMIFNDGFKVFYSNIGRYTVTRRFNSSLSIVNLLGASDSSSYSFYMAQIWNYNLRGFFATLCSVIVVFTVFNNIKRFFVNRLFDYILLPAVYPLYNYFLHLSFIGIMVSVVGYNFLNKLNTYFIIISIIAICYLISYILQKKRTLKKADKTQGYNVEGQV